MCKKFLLSGVCFLIFCAFCCSFVVAGSYSEISVKVDQIEKIEIYRPTTKRIDSWIYDYGKIVLLAGNTIEIYDNNGNILKNLVLPMEYQEIQMSEDGSIFLRSKNNSHILIIKNDSYEHILIPDHFKVWSMHLMRGMLILNLCSNEAVILKNGSWEKYPTIQYVGRDQFAYFYQYGKLNKYDENGVLVEKYNTYFDLDLGYSLGIDEKGIWFLLTEPFIDKRDGIDTLKFIYFDPIKQQYAYFILPCGDYDLGKGFIYGLENQIKLMYQKEVMDNMWPANLVIITKWKIDKDTLY